MIDESADPEFAGAAAALRACGHTGWTEGELAGLVDLDTLPRHPVVGCRVDGTTVARESRTSREIQGDIA